MPFRPVDAIVSTHCSESNRPSSRNFESWKGYVTLSPVSSSPWSCLVTSESKENNRVVTTAIHLACYLFTLFLNSEFASPDFKSAICEKRFVVAKSRCRPLVWGRLYEQDACVSGLYGHGACMNRLVEFKLQICSPGLLLLGLFWKMIVCEPNRSCSVADVANTSSTYPVSLTVSCIVIRRIRTAFRLGENVKVLPSR